MQSPVKRISVLTAVAIAALAQGHSSNSEERVNELHEQANQAAARGDLAGAARAYEQIITISPKLAPAYNNLGSLYARLGEYDKAVDVLEKGLTVDPHMTAATALLGMSLYELGRYADARPKLEEALQTNPSDANVELFLANDLTKTGDFVAAARHFENLSARRPKDPHLLYLLARVYMQLGQQTLAKMNAIDPDSVWAHEISGEIDEGMKNYDGAIIEYKKAVEIAPKQPGVHFKLGDLYWSLSHWENAAEQFRAELAIDPKNCMAQWKLGDILIQQSLRPDEALADLDKALAMCPALDDARLDRGRALLELHRNDEALPELLAAGKHAPEEANVHFLLARAYRALGRKEEAQAEMRTFSTLDEKARAAAAERAQEAIKNKQSAH